MKKLFAPWRLEFILSDSKSKSRKNALFKELGQKKPSFESLVLYKAKLAYIVMNKFPYTNGHLLVIPYRQIKDLEKLTVAEHQELGALLSLSVRVLKKVLKPEGFNVGLNLGKAAGAGILNHLHYHIVPRWVGDTNFMPVFSETKVLPEHLKATYIKLKASFDASLKK